MDPEQQEFESNLRQTRAREQRKDKKVASFSVRRGTPKIDGVDLGLGLVVAGIFDLFSLIPIIGNAISVFGIGMLWLWFWLKGVKKIGVFGGVGMGIEAIPLLSVLPANIGFVVAAFIVDRIAGKIIAKLPAPARKVAQTVTSGPTKALAK